VSENRERAAVRSAFRDWLVKWRAAPSAPALALAAVLAVVYAPLAAGQLVYNRDLSRFIYPIRWFVRDSLARGDRPWWTPHIGLGHAMLADPQAALFYPANLLTLVGSLPHSLMLLSVLHLFWGGIGMAYLARALRQGQLAALTSGVAWALSGYVTSLWTNGARLPSAAWMPWQALLFVAVARAARDGQRRLRAAVGLALAIAMGYLAGDLFVAMMGQMLGVGLAVVVLATEGSAVPAGHARRLVMHGAGLSVLAVGLAALLSAATIVPALRALASTERAGGLAAATAQAGSLHPVRMAEFAAPEAFARAWYLHPDSAWVGRYLEGAPLSFSVYLGGSVLALCVLALAPRRKRDAAGPGTADAAATDEQVSPARAATVAGLGLLFLLVALGHHTPLFGILRRLLPPLAYMRAPEKWLLAVVPCLALLAGMGAQRLTAPERRPPWPWGLGVPGMILVLAVLAPVVLPAELGGQVRQGAWHGLAASLLVGAAWPLARRRPRLAGVFLVLVMVADLALGTGLSLRFSDARALEEPPLVHLLRPTASPALPFPRLYRGSKVQLHAFLPGDLDGSEVTRETLRDNLSVPFGIAVLPGYGVATSPALTALLERGRVDALRLLATDYALLSAPKAEGAVADGLSLLSASIPGVRVYRVARALPRVFVTFAAQPLPEDQLAARLLDPEVVAGKLALLDQRQGWPSGQQPLLPPVPCRLEGFTNVAVRATCDVPTSGLAVFVEQYAEGWHASVDGAPAPLLRANAVMRAVPVPAGQHSVELAFAPPGLRTGAWLSLLGLSAVLALLLAARRGPSASG
jgi:hypothetical protein